MENREWIDNVRNNFKIRKCIGIAGRIIAKRKIGKIIFFVLRDQSGSIQLICSKDVCHEKLFSIAETIEEGDIISVEGETTFSKTNEKSLFIKNCTILRKCQMTDFIGSKKTKGSGYREKFIEISVNQEKSEYYANCSQIISQIRGSLCSRGFLEFNTGILHSHFEGGLAQPFETHLKARNKKLYLRPALEIKLKQLLASGYEEVFEVGNVFRNEGFNSRNSPEFIVLECYKAFSDCNDMMSLFEIIIKEAILKVFDESNICKSERLKDLLEPWKRVSFAQVLNETGGERDSFQRKDELQRILSTHEFTSAYAAEGQMVRKVLEKIIIPKITFPTYITEIPLSAFPLTKASSENEGTSEGAILVIDGEFVGDIYTDENDPEIIENRLIEQSKQTGKPINESLVDLLKFGLPPSAGFGLGVNRLLLILRGNWKKDIQETFVFPPLK
ncbi:hypothetical protein KAH94_05190 [bacterium]|nr:hypothetical protein [bacterium]